MPTIDEIESECSSPVKIDELDDVDSPKPTSAAKFDD